MKKVDILYIHPTKDNISPKYSMMPVGIISLLNLLKSSGYDVYAINVGIELSLDKNYSIEDEIRSIEYKMLIVDLHWYEHSYGAIEVVRISKKINKIIPTVLGGLTSTIYSTELLSDFEEVDYIIKGDGERPVLLLADYLLKEKGQIESIPNLTFRKEKSIVDKYINYYDIDFDSYNYLSIDFLKNSKYFYYLTPDGIKQIPSTFWLFIGKGCVYNCSYCCGSNRNSKELFGIDRLRVRNPISIAEDINILAENGLKVVAPTHDFEILGADYYETIFKNLNKATGIYLESFQLPGVGFTDKLFSYFDKKMSKIVISPLTGDVALRRKNGKRFDNEEFMKLLTYFKNENIRVELYYSLNLPTGQFSHFQSTLEQIEQIISFYPSDLLSIIVRKVVIDPLAPMRGFKGIKSSLDNFKKYYEYAESSNENEIGYTLANDYELKDAVEYYEAFKVKMYKLKQQECCNFLLL